MGSASGPRAAHDEPVALGDHIQLVDEQHFELGARLQDVVNIAGKRNSIAYLNHQLLSIPGVEMARFSCRKNRATRRPGSPVCARSSSHQVSIRPYCFGACANASTRVPASAAATGYAAAAQQYRQTVGADAAHASGGALRCARRPRHCRGYDRIFHSGGPSCAAGAFSWRAGSAGRSAACRGPAAAGIGARRGHRMAAH